MTLLHPNGDLLVLGIETSCDETAAAIVRGDGRVMSAVTRTQIPAHRPFGGVVPEVASRAHLELLPAVINQALVEAGAHLDEIGAVAATVGPGLIGSLLVGVSEAKGMAYALGVPFVGVHHMEAHLFALVLDDETFAPPATILLVSGGHTLIVQFRAFGDYEVLGETLDDAAGEAFDKVARYLGLEYPGGPAIDNAARSGNPAALALPRAMRGQGLDMSFSGLKTAVITALRKASDEGRSYTVEDVAASFQEAVVDVLVDKTMAAARLMGSDRIGLGGGVAANSRLRARITAAAEGEGIAVSLPTLAFCTDNAAMVAAAGAWRLAAEGRSPWSVGAIPSLPTF